MSHGLRTCVSAGTVCAVAIAIALHARHSVVYGFGRFLVAVAVAIASHRHTYRIVVCGSLCYSTWRCAGDSLEAVAFAIAYFDGAKYICKYAYWMEDGRVCGNDHTESMAAQCPRALRSTSCWESVAKLGLAFLALGPGAV